MKKLMLTILFLSLSTLAFSSYKDVVKMKLSDGCSMQDIVELKDNFNNIMKKNGYDYNAEIWMPTFYPEETAGHCYWVGTAPDLADFGPEFTRYFNEVSKGSTPEAKLENDFNKCRTEVSRSGFQAQ